MMMILFSFVHVLFFFLFLLSLSMREIYTKALLLLLTTTTKTTRVPLFDVVVDAKGDAKRDDDDVKTNVSPSFFTLSLLFRVSDTLNMTCSIFFSPLKKYARF